MSKIRPRLISFDQLAKDHYYVRFQQAGLPKSVLVRHKEGKIYINETGVEIPGCVKAQLKKRQGVEISTL